MWTNLLVWLLALYGTISLIVQTILRYRAIKQAGTAQPVAFVLIVENAENTIEGLLRMLLYRTANALRPHTICVLDLSDSGETEHIVKRLSLKNPCLVYERVENEAALTDMIALICTESSSIGCIYDLRQYAMIRDITRDMAAMCRAK